MPGSWTSEAEKEAGEPPREALRPEIPLESSGREGARLQEDGGWGRASMPAYPCLTLTSVHGRVDEQKDGCRQAGWGGDSRQTDAGGQANGQTGGALRAAANPQSIFANSKTAPFPSGLMASPTRGARLGEQSVGWVSVPTHLRGQPPCAAAPLSHWTQWPELTPRRESRTDRRRWAEMRAPAPLHRHHRDRSRRAEDCRAGSAGRE